MKKILIINAHQKYESFAEGNLTQSYIDKANNFFTKNGFEVKNTAIDKGYDVKEELEKFAWADYVLFQYPVYWMSLPWISKKYIDEICSGGAGTVTYESDGRSRTDASKKYGSGGLLKGKKYMLSITYNCPESEFDNKDGFFEGLSLDQANFAVHKTFQFCGLEQLKTYSVHDVYKGDLNLEKELEKFEDILKDNFL
ncbi:flavodoxin [Malaciobacter molluscorum LMG 25693]|uniref:Flavodoxin n=1 Tax=Malaciobacter molluscorum LMG 25693 TaxID=870501 RepID=A0A2G1DH15_9BACT|nr:NAD(P)H-dependent oxidoreductase [Malaciobacter molluscorum]AXX92295.1 flavodoxin-like fold domain-containing protein, putative NAD(P)H (quinone) dehydrogenase/reductase [Malaciobacter molluscorum LMG 25693]PHO17720.1 flavodoxin [Malaciobacter molluscorum LMG 25693]